MSRNPAVLTIARWVFALTTVGVVWRSLTWLASMVVWPRMSGMFWMF